MAKHRLLDEYENGWKAVQGEEKFYVQTPSDEEIEFGSSWVIRNNRPTRLFAALCVKHGLLPILEDAGVIPVPVALGGKPEIAAYLWAVHYGYHSGYNDRDDIADDLGISPETLSKYGRRVLRSVAEQRVAGRGW